MTWEKTEKTGAAGGAHVSGELEDDLRADARYERRLFWRCWRSSCWSRRVVAARTVLG